MPKKRHTQALRIKPGDSNNSSALQTSQQQERKRTRRSVNELIRESRRLQFHKQGGFGTPVVTTGSVPPQVRQALNLPEPEGPALRPGLVVAGHGRNGTERDLALKELAGQWNWHAEYYGEWLAEELPVQKREALLSYIGVYSAARARVNPLRLLFMTALDEESRAEVMRLDLTGAIGAWTTLKQLHRDLGPAVAAAEDERGAGMGVPDAWDEDHPIGPQLQRLPSGPMFKNLQHLSLALSPGQMSGASWKDLIQLAGKVSTITSLSLAFWPLPTYTPRAASSRVVVPSATSRPQVVYGGTNMYSPFDDDWRESAGILRSLSRALYCLKWLDLTGCASWFPALTWTGEEVDHVALDWNGWWRGVQQICLAVGWEPIEPQAKSEEDHEYERRKYAYEKERKEHETLAGTAKTVAEQLRAIRRLEGGKWMEFQF
ncbi:hypothetical protein DV737_g1163, partial [Chaetothyriales sp. CBS 132003]